MSKFKSFAITIRPKHGIPERQDLQVHLERQLHRYKYQLFAYEMEGTDRHLHAQIWTDDPKRRSDIVKQFQRIQSRYDPDWSPAAARVCANGIKVAYNDDFLTYILKDTDDHPDRYREVLPIPKSTDAS